MAAYLTDGVANAMLNLELGALNQAIPPTWYVGLSTSPATKAGQVIDGYGHRSEVTGNGYARVAVANNSTNFPATSGGSKSNATAITFPTPTGNWGTVVSAFLADSLSGGYIWFYWDLPSPIPVVSGVARSFGIGSLIFSHT